MGDLGRLTKLDLREVWANEAQDFTPWLAENLSALGEALGMDLELVGQEAPAGDFSVDIVARNLGNSELVIIENQLAATNHDHLGKIITYASAYDATSVIWVTPSFREEHRQALDWLNQHTDADTNFFGILVEVVKIDESRPAFTFRPVAFPNEWRKDKVKGPKAAPSSRGQAYQEFFQKLVDTLREDHHFTNARSVQPSNWYSFAGGITGLRYSASFAEGNRARAEVYIDIGEAEDNKRLFDQLHNMKAELERAFGESLDWERLDDRRACRIAVYRRADIMAEDQDLQKLQDWFVQRLLQFKKVFGPPIDRLLKG